LSIRLLIPDSANGSAPERFPGFAGGQQAVAVGRGQALRVEQERRRDDVLAAGQNRAHLVEIGGARGVEHAVGLHRQYFRGVGRREHAERVTPDEYADVLAVLVFGVDLRADQIEVGSVVEDRGDHLRTDGPGAPWNDSVRRVLLRHTEARYRG
jgi:hypothetical protein